MPRLFRAGRNPSPGVSRGVVVPSREGGGGWDAGSVSKVRYTFRARVGSRAELALIEEWRDCRWIWNQAVTAKKYGYWVSDKDLTFWRQDPDTAWLRKGSVVVQQQTIRTFWAGKGRKRFKTSKRDQPSVQYTARGFSLKEDSHGRVFLRLAGGIRVNVVWSRDLPSTPSSVRVYRDTLNQWWVSFVVDTVDKPLPATGRAIGIDWGISDIATTTSDSHDLPHPKYGRAAQATLTKYQRQMARRKPTPGQKASRGYKQAKKNTARAHAKVRNQRTHTARTWAKAVVHDHDQIAVENFKPTFMFKNRSLARAAADAAVGATKRILIETATRAGRKVVLVPPAHTTTDCSDCGARAKQRLELSQRIYECWSCGLIMPRDKNSARLVLAAAGFVRADADHVRPAARTHTALARAV